MMYNFIRHIRRIVLFTLVATLLPAVGNSQAIASNFQELRFRVEPGDIIYITDRISGEPRALAFPARSPSLGALQQPRQQQRLGWIGRHPVLFGTLVGFGGGFLIGYSRGDDGVFDDFTAEFNGLVLGGVGAGVGAMSGAILAR